VAIGAKGDGDQLIAEVRKNRMELIRLRRTTFNGRELLDCRVWVESAVPGGEGTVTKKGLTLPPATWRKLLPLIERGLHEFDEHDGEEADD